MSMKTDILCWVGPEKADELSSMAYEVLFEVYTYVPLDGIQRFYDENQTSDVIKEQMERGYRYAFVMDNGERIGYISFLIEGQTMEFSKYYILKGHRGHGVGSDVLDLIISIARDSGVKRIFLHVNKMNEGAIRMYKRKGFVETGTRQGYNTSIVDMDLTL